MEELKGDVNAPGHGVALGLFLSFSPFFILVFANCYVNGNKYEINGCVEDVLFVTGATPFMLSAQSGHVSTVKYFLDHGGRAGPEISGARGETIARGP